MARPDRIKKSQLLLLIEPMPPWASVKNTMTQAIASTTTVRSVHLMLHAALERAVKERLISRNPTEDCIAPKPRKLQMQILPPEAIHAYLEAAKARELLPMFYLELVGGLRKGELLALRWDNADIQNRTISVSKQHILDPDWATLAALARGSQ